jgi:entry exclusion lipoprotein TrbK
MKAVQATFAGLGLVFLLLGCGKAVDPPLEANDENCAKVAAMPEGAAKGDLFSRCLRRVKPAASSPAIEFKVR